MAQLRAVSGIESADESGVSYLEREFIDRREPSSSTIRDHLCRVACADHCGMVVMAFRTQASPPRELFIHDLLGHDARMRVWAFGGILFPLPLRVHDFVRAINVQDVIEGT